MTQRQIWKEGEVGKQTSNKECLGDAATEMEKVVWLPPRLADLLRTTTGSHTGSHQNSSLRAARLAKCHERAQHLSYASNMKNSSYAGVCNIQQSDRNSGRLKISGSWDEFKWPIQFKTYFTTCSGGMKEWKTWAGIWKFRACEHTCWQTSNRSDHLTNNNTHWKYPVFYKGLGFD